MSAKPSRIAAAAGAPAGARWLPALAILALVTAGCATDEPGISPDRDGFYFPGSAALHPSQPVLFVANSNADLKFNGGTITALDLSALPADLSQMRQAVAAGELSDCRPAPNDPTLWECGEAQFIEPDATLRIGDFPGNLVVHPDGERMFTALRGADHLLWVDIVSLDSGKIDLRCNSALEGGCGGIGTERNCPVWDCDDAHRVGYSEELRRSLPDEPFAVYVNDLGPVYVAPDGAARRCLTGDSAELCPCRAAADRRPGQCQGAEDVDCCVPEPPLDHVYVAHLLGGEISYFTSEQERVVLRDIRSGFFTGDQSLRGAYAMAARQPGDPASPIYVSSRAESVLASFIIRDDLRIVDSGRTVVGGVFPGNDSRGIAWGPDRDRLYVVSRAPAALVSMDMTLDKGQPRGVADWVVEVCASPTGVALDAGSPAAGGGEGPLLAYVVCFGTSQIYVVDTVLGQVIDQIPTGQGPNEIIIDSVRRRAFVPHFLENTVGVIDLDPSHATFNRLVLRIGDFQRLVRD